MAIYIEGQLRTRKWQDQSGKDRYTTEVVVDIGGSMQMLGGKQNGGQQNNQRQQAAQQNQGWGKPQAPAPSAGSNEPPMDFDDDIPF